MNKVKISTMLLMMLLTVTASTSIASANETSEIEFNALAKGKCFVGFTIMTFIDEAPGYNIEFLFDGLGKGSVEISGSAEAVSVPTEYPPPQTEPPFHLLGEEIYLAESLSAQGFTSVSWKDDDKIRHWLFVSIYSSEPNPWPCIFSPETDYFWIPMPGQDPTIKFLRFDAIHVSGSGFEVISGIAFFAVMPFPFGPGTTVLHDPAVVLFLVWWDEEAQGQYQYSILWSSETREITDLMPFDPFDIKAAKVFESNVEVVS